MTLKREQTVSRVNAVHAALTSRDAREENAREQDINRSQLSVIPEQDFDDIESEFFAKGKTISDLLTPEDAKALDAMLERAGLRGLLLSLVSLLESRVTDGVFRGDTLILHLSREDRYAAAAEMLQNMAFNKVFDL